MNKSIIKASLLILLLLLLACSNNNSNNQSIKKQLNKQEEITNANYNEEFIKFWNKFKTAVLEKDEIELKNIVYFPFEDSYNEIYDPSASLSCENINEFLKNFDLIFDECVIQAIKNNKYRGYDNNYAYYGDLIGRKDFLLIPNCSNRDKDLHFTIIDDKYYLRGIQYYE
ncbi:MAG: hypothetical protein HOF38_01875 [Elusimicrobiaceae bacterium]|jgi:hypothetical protein|nr:hypothetical protein [Elusimicrobiaceae bacterium]MBT3954896.1 hypothetical protein [Elusimicrobiaceae bacterium]MBT4008030.1 hypothetical protein [Elusimicrobiaceae bacterium]MBT4403175.1 hypothetical protein [Elusimicrobiaceae bacterium]MBT4439688.1 hypothetical protein [Elusimicrobiaceae bacterium]